MRSIGWMLLVLGACEAVPEAQVDAPPGVDDAAGEDMQVDAPPPCDLTAAFGTPVLVMSPGGGFGLDATETIVTFTNTTATSGQSSIYIAKRANRDADFGAPERLDATTATNKSYYETYLSPDALTLFVHGYTPGSVVNNDIFYATRPTPADPFGAATALPGYGGSLSEHGAYMTNTSMYYAHTPTGGTAQNHELVHVARSSLTFTDTRVLAELNSPGSEQAPVVTEDELQIWFGSNRGGGAERIYTATRTATTAPFSAPALANDLNGTGQRDIPQFLSPDGCRMYIESQRDGVYGMYMATRPL